ncbi:MAG: HD domain-containing protein [Eubacteriales bacterium]|nr:HD domain-containing protein [Eubacteriales bacterium]
MNKHRISRIKVMEIHNTVLIENTVRELCGTSRFGRTAEYMQHGNISIYEHCIAVARAACRIAGRLPFDVDYRSLVRGALLHDYFLYDWHDTSMKNQLHGYFHPSKALKNALEDFNLTPREANIILRHMFPLTPLPPRYRESWIVCIADKVCALRETLRINEWRQKKYTGEGPL